MHRETALSVLTCRPLANNRMHHVCLCEYFLSILWTMVLNNATNSTMKKCALPHPDGSNACIKRGLIRPFHAPNVRQLQRSDSLIVQHLGEMVVNYWRTMTLVWRNLVEHRRSWKIEDGVDNENRKRSF